MIAPPNIILSGDKVKASSYYRLAESRLAYLKNLVNKTGRKELKDKVSYAGGITIESVYRFGQYYSVITCPVAKKEEKKEEVIEYKPSGTFIAVVELPIITGIVKHLNFWVKFNTTDIPVEHKELPTILYEDVLVYQSPELSAQSWNISNTIDDMELVKVPLYNRSADNIFELLDEEYILALDSWKSYAGVEFLDYILRSKITLPFITEDLSSIHNDTRKHLYLFSTTLPSYSAYYRKWLQAHINLEKYLLYIDGSGLHLDRVLRKYVFVSHLFPDGFPSFSGSLSSQYKVQGIYAWNKSTADFSLLAVHEDASPSNARYSVISVKYSFKTDELISGGFTDKFRMTRKYDGYNYIVGKGPDDTCYEYTREYTSTPSIGYPGRYNVTELVQNNMFTPYKLKQYYYSDERQEGYGTTMTKIIYGQVVLGHNGFHRCIWMNSPITRPDVDEFVSSSGVYYASEFAATDDVRFRKHGFSYRLPVLSARTYGSYHKNRYMHNPGLKMVYEADYSEWNAPCQPQMVNYMAAIQPEIDKKPIPYPLDGGVPQEYPDAIIGTDWECYIDNEPYGPERCSTDKTTHKVMKYPINSDGTIDFNGDLILSRNEFDVDYPDGIDSVPIVFRIEDDSKNHGFTVVTTPSQAEMDKAAELDITTAQLIPLYRTFATYDARAAKGGIVTHYNDHNTLISSPEYNSQHKTSKNFILFDGEDVTQKVIKAIVLFCNKYLSVNIPVTEENINFVGMRLRYVK